MRPGRAPTLGVSKGAGYVVCTQTYVFPTLICVTLLLGVSSPAGASTGTGWLYGAGVRAIRCQWGRASSANDLWVVGDEGIHVFAQHWNGDSGTAPQVAPTEWTSNLASVTEISPTNLWAVGDQYSLSAQDGQDFDRTR